MEISSSYFIYINIALIIFFAFHIVKNYYVGVFGAIINLSVTILSVLISWFVADVLANKVQMINLKVSESIKILDIKVNYAVNFILWFVIIFIVLKIIGFLGSKASKKINKTWLIGGINKLAGAILGFAMALVYAFIIIFLLNTPLVKNGDEVINNTILKTLNPVYHSIKIKDLDINVDSIKKFLNKNSELKKKDISDFVDSIKALNINPKSINKNELGLFIELKNKYNLDESSIKEILRKINSNPDKAKELLETMTKPN